jgi:hypothetical protein
VELRDYIEQLRQIDAPMQSVFYWFKQEVIKLLQETYNAQRNPYGQRWVERQQFYPHPILDRTGIMKGAFKIRMSGDTYSISNEARNENGIAYASYHQYGTKYLPIRQVIPEVEVPEHWKAVLEDYFAAKIQEYLE